eukprot:TRINITY_DN5258_c0_g1_i2.p1 TRINITY_DN5258_c0_g1~~TRINITY_DN5258_c0_g1_i2.p1  ORF type:complete len:713 (-),score=181.08 TRINITY_DN5258_c0_g1_i2:291-2429(-)
MLIARRSSLRKNIKLRGRSCYKSTTRITSIPSYSINRSVLVTTGFHRFYSQEWGRFPTPDKNNKNKTENDKKDDKDEGKEEGKEEKARENFKEDFKEDPLKTMKKKKKQDDSGSQNNNNNNGNSYLKWLFIVPLIFLPEIFIFFGSGENEITFVEFQRKYISDYGFESIEKLEVVNSDYVSVIKKNGEGGEYFRISSAESFERNMQMLYRQYNIPDGSLPIFYKKKAKHTNILLSVIPTLAFVGGMMFLLNRSIPKPGAMGGGKSGIFNVGKSKHKRFDVNKKVKVSFKDVAGCEEAKLEVSEFVGFLKNPQKYIRLGAKIPRGALLVGPPGTGKTLLAKAMAGEASVPFFSVSGSEFIEMFVGVGPSRVRDLFKEGRKNAPCIIFIDEIDAIGRKRGGHSGGNDERDNTLNQLLVELDGFEENSGVVVIAGTNRDDILDKALMRPGRFDRKIAVDNPDVKARAKIFGIHLAKLTLKANIQYLATKLAAFTPGFSGADIANVCNEAALYAARKDKESVDIEDFEQAIDRVIAGLEKKSKTMSPEEKERVAYHEAGHAAVSWLLEDTDVVLKVSIIPRGRGALGFSQQMGEDAYIHTYEHLVSKICVLLGGRAAEEVKFGEVSSGAQDDLERVTNIAYSQILRFGMNDVVGPLAYTDKTHQGYSGKNYSEETSQIIDSEVKKLVEECYTKTKEIIRKNFDSMYHQINIYDALT